MITTIIITSITQRLLYYYPHIPVTIRSNVVADTVYMNNKQSNPPHACISCFKGLELGAMGEKDEIRYPLDATMVAGMPHYGSDYDYYDTTIYFLICDECVERAEIAGYLYENNQGKIVPVRFDENFIHPRYRK